MNAETAAQHPSRLVGDAVTPVEPSLTDPLPGDVFPVSASMPAGQWSQPSEEVAHEMRIHTSPAGFEIQVTCTCTENGKPWRRTLDGGHTIEDLVRFAAMHEGPGQPGENKGEPDGLVGPGPVTDFSSPSSPLEQCFGCGSAGGPFTGVAELLPDGSFGTEHLYCRDIAPCNDRRDALLLSFGGREAEAPFGSESEPQS